jgi:hypothetical protein
VEDWASDYSIPLGLTSSVTVFSNRQIIVFLLKSDVVKVTLWWDGSDMAAQTSYAYMPGPFSDNPQGGTLNNGKLNMQFSSDFNVTSTVGSSTSRTSFMLINKTKSSYGASLAYVIYNGVVRDIVQQEAEWNNYVRVNKNCANLYANIVLTLPAGTSYFTYQLKLMFIDSTAHPRTITDLVPLQLYSSPSSLLVQTEFGTMGSIPVVVNGTGTFSDYGGGTAHHWSQIINNSTGTGAGIMFTEASNQQLYFFDSKGSIPGATGALKVNSTTRTIELAPVTSLHQVSGYNTPSGEEVTWYGAVATFDANAIPIYELNGGAPVGLWMLVEVMPRATVTGES